jgi:hypothetical protein
MGFFSRIRSKSSVDPLDDLLTRAAHNPALREQFYHAMLESTLHVPGEIQQGELFIRPYTVHGRKTLLLFTSPAMVSVLRDHPTLVEVEGRLLLQASAGFETTILNYGSRNEKEFTPPEIRALLDGSIFQPASRNGATDETSRGMMVGQPKEYPVRLMNELQRALPSRHDIRAAYLAQITYEGDTTGPIIVIAFDTDISDDEFGQLCAKVTAFAEGIGTSGIRLTRLANDPLGEYLRTETTPFYQGA